MADVAFCLSAQINWSLENDLCGNAVFLSERLYALQDSEENLLQLAKSYMRSNQAIRAYFLLASEIRQMTDNDTANSIKYLFARACLALEKYQEGESALLKGSALEQFSGGIHLEEAKNVSTEDLLSVPHGAAGLHLLGCINRKMCRPVLSKCYFRLSLRLEPCLIDSYFQLCELGTDLDAYQAISLEDTPAYDLAHKLYNHPVVSSFREHVYSIACRASCNKDNIDQKSKVAGKCVELGKEDSSSDTHKEAIPFGDTREEVENQNKTEFQRENEHKETEKELIEQEQTGSVNLVSTSLHLSHKSKVRVVATPTGVHRNSIEPNDDLDLALNETSKNCRSKYCETVPTPRKHPKDLFSIENTSIDVKNFGECANTPKNSLSVPPKPSHGEKCTPHSSFTPKSRNLCNTKSNSVSLTSPNLPPSATLILHAHDSVLSPVPKRLSLTGTLHFQSPWSTPGYEIEEDTRQTHDDQESEVQYRGKLNMSSIATPLNIENSHALTQNFITPTAQLNFDLQHSTCESRVTIQTSSFGSRSIITPALRNRDAHMPPPSADLASPSTFPLHPTDSVGSVLNADVSQHDLSCGINRRPPIRAKRPPIRPAISRLSFSSATDPATEKDNDSLWSPCNVVASYPAFPTSKSSKALNVPSLIESVEESIESQDVQDPHQIWFKGIHELLSLLQIFGAGMYALSKFQSDDAIKYFKKLQPEQYNTGWVYCQIARAYFEKTEYKKACEMYESMRRIQSHRMEGLEIYSTILWHLKLEAQLSQLAQEVLSLDRLSPQTWCVLGNCLSLHKEHTNALKFFNRALQIDPHFAYAHSLSGHEYVANEDLEQATSSFRAALRLNERMYNAWYGLGTIYYRQEKYELAESHFRRALALHPHSSVLKCYLGMTLHARHDCIAALDILNTSIESKPTNPQMHFQRASVLLSMNRPQDAYESLLIVREFAPRESQVHLLLGKVLMKMGRFTEALRTLNVAMDLCPKENRTIKSLIERVLDKMAAEDETCEENNPSKISLGSSTQIEKI